MDGIAEPQQAIAQVPLVDELVEADEAAGADVRDDAARHDGLAQLFGEAVQELLAERLAVCAHGRLDGGHAEIDGGEILAVLQVIVHELDADHQHPAVIGEARLLVHDDITVLVELVPELPEAADEPDELALAVDRIAVRIDGVRAATRDALAELMVLRLPVAEQFLSGQADSRVNDVQTQFMVRPADNLRLAVEAEKVEERFIGPEETLLTVLPEKARPVIRGEAAPEDGIAPRLIGELRRLHKAIRVGNRLEAVSRPRPRLDDERLDTEQHAAVIVEMDLYGIEAHPGIAAIRLANAEAVRMHHLLLVQHALHASSDIGKSQEAGPVRRVDFLAGIAAEKGVKARIMRLAEREPLLHADEHVADIFLHVEEKDILIHPAEVAHDVIRLPHLVVVLELLRDILKFCLINVQCLG